MIRENYPITLNKCGSKWCFRFICTIPFSLFVLTNVSFVKLTCRTSAMSDNRSSARCTVAVGDIPERETRLDGVMPEKFCYPASMAIWDMRSKKS